MATFTTWQQNVEYDARKDRAPISELFGEGVLDLSGGALAVSERSAGANMSVDVAAGRCVVDGDEQADQETYLAVFDASTNLTIASADPDQARKDRVIVRVQDSAVSGTSDGPVREVLTGTAGSSPSAPAIPDSAISLAIIDVAAGTPSITDANITDDRSAGSAGGGPHGMTIYTTAGSHTFTVPDRVQSVKVTAVGAGGGGGPGEASSTTAGGGGGGGSGGVAFDVLSVSPGDTIDVTVGAGGSGAVGGGSNGTNGGDSSTSPGPTAAGGFNGFLPDNGNGGGGTFEGEDGEEGVEGVDTHSSHNYRSGRGGRSFFGAGGRGKTAHTTAGNINTGLGGEAGGGGSGGLAFDTTSTADGGDGGDGVVMIEW